MISTTVDCGKNTPTIKFKKHVFKRRTFEGGSRRKSSRFSVPQLFKHNIFEPCQKQKELLIIYIFVIEKIKAGKTNKINKELLQN